MKISSVITSCALITGIISFSVYADTNEDTIFPRSAHYMDSCKHDRFAHAFKTCICADTGNTGTCRRDYFKNESHCECSNDECENNHENIGKLCQCPPANTMGICTVNANETGTSCNCDNVKRSSNTTENNLFAQALKTCGSAYKRNTETCSAHAPKDNAFQSTCSHDAYQNNQENIGELCQCPDTNSIGMCTGNPDGSCDCGNKKQTISSTEFASGHEPSMDAKRATLKKMYDINVYSTNIDAPIYNIPLQRSLAPITECTTWWFAAAPFFKSKSTQHVDNYLIDNVESGVMFNAGVYSSMYLHTLFTIAGSATHIHQQQNDDPNARVHRVPCDVFVGLGAQTDNDEWYKLNGEIFFAACSERTKMHPAVAEMYSLGTGFQCTADFCLAEYNASKYELSSLARATYFVPKTSTFEDDKTHGTIGTVTYAAGTFLDLFLSLKQYYGSEHQHQIDIGYNPTIHVQNVAVKPVQAHTNIELDCHGEDIKTLRNTVFGTYAYNWNLEDVVMNITVGATATIIPSSTTYGTLFAAYSVGF